jgi:hypothetical protein
VITVGFGFGAILIGSVGVHHPTMGIEQRLGLEGKGRERYFHCVMKSTRPAGCLNFRNAAAPTRRST